ncbi:hypothetical protein ACQPZF_28955 [Actinosynnema sp. CS-041913]
MGRDGVRATVLRRTPGITWQFAGPTVPRVAPLIGGADHLCRQPAAL